MRQTQLDVLRVSLGWDGIEPERDKYDFGFWDEFVRMAVDEYGVRLIPYVAYTPDWNSEGGPNDHYRSPPKDNAEFAELLGLLAARYRGKISSWELWNEPDNPAYWTGSAEQYAALLQAGAKAVHQVDATLEVVSGGLAGTVDFLAKVLAVPNTANQIDVVNVHSYYETWNPEPLETLPSYMHEVAALVHQHGGQQRIWMAEVGYGNYRRGTTVSEHVRARFDYEHTLTFQAVVLVRTLAMLLADPVTQLIAWYELKDPPATDEVIGDENNRHLGVAFADHRPKPALQALAFMQRIFRSGFQNVDAQARVESSGAEGGTSSARVHAFWIANGSLVLIAWLTTAGPQPRDAVDATTIIDFRRELAHVTLPYALSATSFKDALGQPREPGTVARLPDGSTRVELELRGGDVQVVELAVAE